MIDFALALNVVLPSGKVPHKVAQVHMAYLVGKEKTQVFTKSGFINDLTLAIWICYPDWDPFNISKKLIQSNMLRFLVTPHTWKNCSKTWIIDRDSPFAVILNHILSFGIVFYIHRVTIAVLHHRGIVILTLKNGPGTILLPVEIRK